MDVYHLHFYNGFCDELPISTHVIDENSAQPRFLRMKDKTPVLISILGQKTTFRIVSEPTTKAMFGSDNFGFGGNSNPAPLGSSFGEDLMTENSKFEKLPEGSREMFKKFEKHLTKEYQTQDKIRQNLENMKQKDQVKVESLTQQILELSTAVDLEINAAKHFKEEVSKDLKHAEVAEAQSSAPQLKKADQMTPDTVYLPSRYHWEQYDKFLRQLQYIKEQIDEVEDALTSNEQSLLAATSMPDSLQSTLKAQHDVFIRLAAKLSELHTRSQEVKEEFIRREGRGAKVWFEDRIKEQYVQKPHSIPQPKKNQQSLPNAPQQQSSLNFDLGGGLGGGTGTDLGFGSSSGGSNTGLGADLFRNTSNTASSLGGSDDLFGTSDTSAFGTSNTSSNSGVDLFGTSSSGLGGDSSFGGGTDLFVLLLFTQPLPLSADGYCYCPRHDAKLNRTCTGGSWGARIPKRCKLQKTNEELERKSKRQPTTK
eukprot:g4560.t1